MKTTTGFGRHLNRQTALAVGLALVVPLGIAPTLGADATEAPQSVGNALAAAPAGATSTLKKPADAQRTRLAEVKLSTAQLATGSTLTWNLFDDVTVDGTVTEQSQTTFKGASSRLWTGTLSDGGTFNVSQYKDAQRVSVRTVGGEYLVLNDTDDAVGLVVELQRTAPVNRDDQGHTERDDETLPEATKPAPALGGTAPAATTEEVTPEADGARTLGRRAAAAPTITPPLLWSNRYGTMSSAGWRGTRMVAPTGPANPYVDEWIQFSRAAFNTFGADDVQREAQAVATVGPLIQSINTTLANSQVSTRVRLQWLSVSNEPQRSTILSEYLAIQNGGDGYMDWATSFRRARKLDHLTQIVVRASSDPDCGRGTLGGSDRVSLTTMGLDCIAQPNHLTYAHEFGHNFSAQHDRTASNPPTTTNRYAYGYVHPGKFRTVMSYPGACGSPCTWLPQFSSPVLTYQGLPTGNATTDNRRAVINWSRTLANTAPATINPGEIRIAGSSRRLYAYSGAWLPWSTRVSFSWYVGGRLVARGPVYSPKQKMNGKTIRLVATGSAPGYAGVSTSSATWKVLRVKGTRFKGRGKVGNTLRIIPGRKAAKKQKAKVVWMRGNKVVGRKLSYRLKRKDAGKNIYAVVTYRAKGRIPDTAGVRWVRIWR